MGQYDSMKNHGFRQHEALEKVLQRPGQSFDGKNWLTGTESIKLDKLRNASDVMAESDLSPGNLAGADMSLLADPAELELIRMLANWPKTVEGAAEAHEPHRVAFYLNDVAALFHGLWNKGKDNVRLRFIDEEDADATRARLALVVGVATVIASGLQVMGVTPLDELR